MAKSAPKEAKPRTDKGAVERDYRTSQLTLRELETKHGVSRVTIIKWAKDLGWVRGDLAKVVRAATTSLLVGETVKQELNRVNQGLTTEVLAAAEANKAVILQHRCDLTNTRGLAIALLEELKLQTADPAVFRAAVQKLHEDASEEARKAAMDGLRKALAVHGRVNSVQKLADTLVKLQQAERKAYGLDEPAEAPPDDPTRLSEEDLDAAISDGLKKLGIPV